MASTSPSAEPELLIRTPTGRYIEESGRAVPVVRVQRLPMLVPPFRIQMRNGLNQPVNRYLNVRSGSLALDLAGVVHQVSSPLPVIDTTVWLVTSARLYAAQHEVPEPESGLRVWFLQLVQYAQQQPRDDPWAAFLLDAVYGVPLDRETGEPLTLAERAERSVDPAEYEPRRLEVGYVIAKEDPPLQDATAQQEAELEQALSPELFEQMMAWRTESDYAHALRVGPPQQQFAPESRLKPQKQRKLYAYSCYLKLQTPERFRKLGTPPVVDGVAAPKIQGPYSKEEALRLTAHEYPPSRSTQLRAVWDALDEAKTLVDTVAAGPAGDEDGEAWRRRLADLGVDNPDDPLVWRLVRMRRSLCEIHGEDLGALPPQPPTEGRPARAASGRTCRNGRFKG